jgi:hypothetical protein
MYLVVAELNEPGPTSFIASLEELLKLIDLVCFPSMLKEMERKCLLCLFPLHAEGDGKEVSIVQLPNCKGEFGR